ncbi:peptide/nickel transport system substrate-binding protein [Rhizobiales bacterium GAS113]|jgi:peptide/nickel transport system substrate-binding protein|nr:peptide/nickel transport system substrate-binding protein [Rhizobiales bacterium GAS113]
MTRRSDGPIQILNRNEAAYIERALKHGASRRDLMHWLVAAGMSLSAAGSILTASTRALAETPKKGGKLRVAGFASSTTDTLDPPKGSNSTDYSRGTTFYNGLTVLDEHLAPQLDLAESIENEKATLWTIKLRKDVRFHDGKPLTSADVVHSLMRHKDPAVGSKARSLAEQMVEVKATGPNEVQIRLASPNADLPVVFGISHFLIVRDGTTDFAVANGTGPYKCKEFQPGVRSIAVRNDEYFKPGKPYLDEIEYFGITDESARINALLSGDVQLAGGVNPRSAKQIQSTPGYELFETKAGGYTDLVVRLDTQPTGNPDFVMALKYLFDRQQIRSAVYRDFAVIGNDQPIDPSNRYYNADLPQRPYDPDKAKFHLQKSGIGATKLPITVSPAADNSVEMGQLLQQSGAKIGLNLDVKRVPADGYWSNYWMKQPIGFGNINPRPSADVLFTLFFKSDAAWNESAWKNEKFDQLLVAARSETDDAKRKQMYGDMQTLVHEGSGIGIPVFASILDGHSSKLKGLRPIPTGGLMGYNFAESVWLDA